MGSTTSGISLPRATREKSVPELRLRPRPLDSFTPADNHQQIVAHGLKTGSEFILKKVAGQNGKKLVGVQAFEAVEQTVAPEPTNGNDHFKEIMAHCMQDAVAIVQSFQDVPFQNEDIRSICSCLFIARTRIN